MISMFWYHEIMIADTAPIRHAVDLHLHGLPTRRKETYKVHGDDVVGIKRGRRDLSGDDVRYLATASGCGRLKEDLESSTRRRRQDFKATPSQ
ncbi:hypothetical protein Tco_1220762 [Tanacetum coccineum]